MLGVCAGAGVLVLALLLLLMLMLLLMLLLVLVLCCAEELVGVVGDVDAQPRGREVCYCSCR